jgi:hypothetical protein
MALYFELSRHSERIVGHLLSASSERLVDAPVAHQLGALGPVLSSIVLWNTVYIDAALQQLRAAGYPGSPQAEKGVLSGLCVGSLAAGDAHRESEGLSAVTATDRFEGPNVAVDSDDKVAILDVADSCLDHASYCTVAV